jgi:ABC-type sulfate transport system permease component
MTAHDTAAPSRKILPARRLTLLASAAALGAAVLFGGPGAYNALTPSPAIAQQQAARSRALPTWSPR